MPHPGEPSASTPALPHGSDDVAPARVSAARAWSCEGRAVVVACVFLLAAALPASAQVRTWSPRQGAPRLDAPRPGDSRSAEPRTWEPRSNEQRHEQHDTEQHNAEHRPQTPWVLPAEFERQEAVLITWDANDDGMQAALVDVVAAAWSRVNFLILVPHAIAESQAARALRAANVPARATRFLRVPTDSVWTRDFGPQVVLQRDGVSRMIDCDYGHGDRVGDDLVPSAIAPSLGMRMLHPPITADGGNIQTNGRGLALTTTSILDHNVDRRYTAEGVAKVFRDYYGITDLVFLEPLVGESTGHVDMFAVFVDADTVVVGQYDPREDPVNHALLERNVARLQRVRGPHGPLRIVRIPMPPKDEKNWRTYTNVLFANGTLLIPQYPDADRHGHAIALATYRKLLPGWTVVGIDCSRLIRWGGAIHCMTMNLAKVPTLDDDAGRGPQDRDELVREESDRDRYPREEFRRDEFPREQVDGEDAPRRNQGFDRSRGENDASDGADHDFRREIGEARPPRSYRPYRRFDDSEGRFGASSRRRPPSPQDDQDGADEPRPGARSTRPPGSGRPMFVPDSRRPAGAARISADAFSADR